MNNFTLFIADVVFKAPLPKTGEHLVTTLLRLAFGVLGGISLIVVTWAGLKYTLSGGDPSKTAEAKNQILYAAIGITIALSAQAILFYATGFLK